MVSDASGPDLREVQTEPLPQAWENAVILKKLDQQKNLLSDTKPVNFRPTVLFTDFDKSYYWDKNHDEAVKLATLAEKYAIPIIVVTGNNALDQVDKIKNINTQHPDNPLPWPDVIAGAIGTEVYVRQQTTDNTVQYTRDDNFHQKIKATGFNHETLSQSAQKIIKTDALKNWGFEFQPITSDPHPFKLGFFTMATEAERPGMLAALQQVFPSVPVISVAEQVEYSRDHEKEIANGGKKRFCIDFIPIEPKRFATDYIIDLLGIKRSFAVGDGGNDANLVRDTKANVGVITGGSTPQLIKEGLIGVNPPTNKPAGEFRKKENSHKRIFVATQNAVAAGGILEAATKYLTLIDKVDPSPLIDQMLKDLTTTYFTKSASTEAR